MMQPTNEKVLMIVHELVRETPALVWQGVLWEFYTAWVHHVSQIALPEEHSKMLFHYERLLDFFKAIENSTNHETRTIAGTGH